MAPIIDDTLSEAGEYGIFWGNSLANYYTGATGIALAEEIDSLGRKWYFVLMNPEARPQWELYSEHHGVNSEERARLAGWIESQYIR